MRHATLKVAVTVGVASCLCASQQLALASRIELFRPSGTNLKVTPDVAEQTPQNALLKRTIDQLNSEDPVQRAEAAATLRRMGPRAAPAIPHLVDSLADCLVPVAWRRYQTDGKQYFGPLAFGRTTGGKEAALALGAIGSAALDPVIRSLKAIEFPSGVQYSIRGPVLDFNVCTAVNAIIVLGNIKDARTVEPLLEARSSAQPKVREQAMWSLAEKVTDSRAKEALLDGMIDEVTEVRIAAVQALIGKLRLQAFEILMKVLRDPNQRSDVQDAVATALADVTEQDFGRNADAWEKWYSRIRAKRSSRR